MTTAEMLDGFRNRLERRRALPQTMSVAPYERDLIEDRAAAEGMSVSSWMRASAYMALEGVSWEEAKAKALAPAEPEVKGADRAGVNVNRDTRAGVEWLDAATLDVEAPQPEKRPESIPNAPPEKDWLARAEAGDLPGKADPRSFRSRIQRRPRT